MRLPLLASATALLLLAFAARADDTRPPVISDVKASVKSGTVHVEARITDETGVLSATVHHRAPGGQVQDTPLVKDQYEDLFRASFPGGPDTEYWIDSSDLLGNGPATYGTSSKPMALGGKARGGPAVAKNEPPAQSEEAAPPPARHHHREHHARTAMASEPPVIEHRKPGAPPPEGRDFTVRMKIHSQSPVAVSILQARPQGTAAFSNTPLTHTEGDSYEATIPAAMAHGTVEYFIAAKNQAGQMTRQGDGDTKTPYTITFKPAAPAQATATGPFSFSHLPLYRVPPGKPVLVRAQIVPSSPDGQLPEHAEVLFRGNDAQDQVVEMTGDETGGYGGFKAELPAQDEGAIFYQIVACDSGSAHCGIDTGSKRKWHGAAVSAQRGGALPMPLDTVSSKAPPGLPE